ncbi:MAG TPA: hypothetical protein VFL12_11800 [Thermoanaerobaculia bacterium]|nr:hypothetical protein [Thermoanaerobaculia bacterium]
MREYRYPSVPALRILVACLLFSAFAPAARAGFPSEEVFLPAIGRIPGALGSQFYTTVWITNLTAAPVHYTFQFLKTGQANASPASFDDSVAAGETKMYENVVGTKFGLASALGAGRIFGDGSLLVAERIYNQPSGAGLGDTEGMFFAAVPKSFSIASGESATIQGVNQGGGEDFRYNFALVETGGATATVNVQVLDAAGALLGQKGYLLSQYEQLQAAITDVVPAIATTNARITATVTSGPGSVILAGAQVTNGTSDNSGFEMSFKGSLLGGGAGTVAHDATLTGDGTGGSPLGVAIPLTLGNGTASVSLASGPEGIFAETTDTTDAGVAIWGRGRVFGTYGDVVDGSEIPHAWGELGRLFNSSNYGVVAVSLDPSGSAMLAQYAGAGAGTAVAMDGALKVTGANPTAFSFKAVNVECGGYCGIISNPLTDGDSTAMLIVTHDYTQDGLYLPSPFSTWYDPGINKWTIYFDDTTSSIAGYAFNVLVIKH